MNQLSETLVICTIAHLDGYHGSVNIGKQSNTMDVYLKNAFVALKSTKLHNPEIHACAILNFDVDTSVHQLFANEGIDIYVAPFNSFRFPPENKWSLAFYKLSALEWAINHLDFSYYVEIDCDVLCNGELTDLIEETEDAIIMLSGPFTNNHPIRKQYKQAYRKLYSEECTLLKWGSGLICGNRTLLRDFVWLCESVYENMRAHDYCNDNYLGDEFITSAAAQKASFPIRDGKAYMNVYWTGRFYLVSTDYYYDKMVFLHLPDEKESGLIDLYYYFVRNKKFPNQKSTYRILNLPPIHYNKWDYYCNKVRRILLRYLL